MSAAGYGIGAALSGFGQAYNAARVRKTQMEVDQRNHLASTLLTLYPNAKPEAQADIAQRILSIYSTPAHKKLDKNLSDISTLGQGGQQGQQGQPGVPVTSQPAGPGGMPLPPPSSGAAAEVSPGGSLPSPPSVTSGTPPSFGAPSAQASSASAPAAPTTQPSYSAWLTPEDRAQQAAHAAGLEVQAKTEAELKARATQADALHLTGRERENFVAGRMVTPYSHFQQKQYVDPNNPGQPMTGFVDPINHVVVDQDGNQIDNPVPWVTAINSPSTPFRAFMQAGQTQGRSQTDLVNDWNQRKTSSTGVRMVPQPDGSIVAVPVTTTTNVQAHGALPSPPGSPQSKSAATGAGAGAGANGKVVGGKVPPEVAKATVGYEDSVSRYNVMTQNLPKAIAGDQQAMLSLLTNHIGMTLGLQKGARITQTILDEARKSAPWLQTIEARFGPDGYMSGVTLTPGQMNSMVDLAEGRLGEDYRKMQETQDFYKGGGKTLPPPPSEVTRKAKGGGSGSAAAGAGPPTGAVSIGTSKKDGKDHYLDGSGKDLGPVQP